MANSHNAEQLEKYCIHYIAMNSDIIMQSQQFREFKMKAHESLFESIMKKVKNESEESFIQIAIQKYKKLEASAEGDRNGRQSSESDEMSLESELMAPKQKNMTVRCNTVYASTEQPLVENFFEQDDLFELSELKDPSSYIYF